MSGGLRGRVTAHEGARISGGTSAPLRIHRPGAPALRRLAMVVLLAITAAVTALPLAAQGPRGRDRGGFGARGDDPTWWGSVDGGYQWSNLVGDPGTASIWDFDASWALRLTAERVIAPRTSIGLGYTYARLPLTIRGASTAAVCRPTCAAEATIARYGVVAHSGGGLGLHLVYEGFLGVAQYSNFTADGNGAAAFSNVTNRDFAWAIGTGAGYGLSPDFTLQAIFDYGSSLHEKTTDLFQRRTTQHYSLRFGARVGL